MSRCERKREVADVEQAGDVCEKYTCSTTLGCVVAYQCGPTCLDQCKIDNVCYTAGAANPNNACQYCNPATRFDRIDRASSCLSLAYE